MLLLSDVVHGTPSTTHRYLAEKSYMVAGDLVVHIGDENNGEATA